MELTLKRLVFADTYTEGWLLIDGVIFCDTLEDKTRDYNKDGDLDEPGEGKVYGETAIPFGRYEVILSHSPRFRKILPEVLGVKHFAGIRIHSGAIPAHSLGCVLVGRQTGEGKIKNDGSSDRLIELLKKKEKHYLTIK